MNKFKFSRLIFLFSILIFVKCLPSGSGFQSGFIDSQERSEPEQSLISISWNKLSEHSFILFKENEETRVDTMSREYNSNLISYRLESSIDSFIVVPYKGQASGFATNNLANINLNSTRVDTICYVYYQGRDTTGLDLATRRINAGLEALYCGVRLVFKPHEVNSSASFNTSSHNNMLKSFWNQGLVPSRYKYYFVEKLSDELNRAHVWNTNALTGFENKHIVFANSGVIKLTFLSIHELIHALTTKIYEVDKNYPFPSIIPGDTLWYKDVMGKEDEHCRYAISQDYFKSLHNIYNVGIDSFIIAARDTLRICDDDEPIYIDPNNGLPDNIILCNAGCHYGNALVGGFNFNEKNHLKYKSVYNAQYDLYFSDIGTREEFTEYSMKSELTHLINTDVKRLGLEHNGSMKSKISSYKNFYSDTKNNKIVKYKFSETDFHQLDQTKLINSNLNKNIKILSDGSFYLTQQDLINGNILISGKKLNKENLIQVMK